MLVQYKCYKLELHQSNYKIGDELQNFSEDKCQIPYDFVMLEKKIN